MRFTIKELEALSGIKAHTIRIWEQRYHILSPARTSSNIRTYTSSELKTLLSVALLNNHGIKISRIAEMTEDQREKAISAINSESAHTTRVVNELIGYMVDLNTVDFEQTLHKYLLSSGTEHTIKKIIYDFLERMDIFWQTNKLVPAHEHVVSHIIRQKIVAAIEQLPFVKKTSPLFILLLPEGEHYEMGLLYVYYLLRSKNIPVLYLGANVPAKDISYLLEIKKPDYLFLHLTTSSRPQNWKPYFLFASQTKLLISGSLPKTQKNMAIPGWIYLNSIKEIDQFTDQFV